MLAAAQQAALSYQNGSNNVVTPAKNTIPKNKLTSLAKQGSSGAQEKYLPIRGPKRAASSVVAV